MYSYPRIRSIERTLSLHSLSNALYFAMVLFGMFLKYLEVPTKYTPKLKQLDSRKVILATRHRARL